MIYQLTVPQFIKTLQNLNKILDKGAAFADGKKIEMDVLLNSRLAPDMLPLTRQIQIACDVAKFSASRLTGKEAPAHEDTEKTLAELHSRIDKVITYLHGFTEADFRDCEKRKVTQGRWEGKYMFGDEFVTQVAIPNFYFHVTTAYAILRNSGVEIGKNDYLGELPKKS
jgi:hypothetical protein